jgi:hypothetical protein
MGMKTVHKHEIPIEAEKTEISLPKDSNLLDVEFLVFSRSVFLWAEVSADLTTEKESRFFKVFKSGIGIPENYTYVGTAIDQYTPEAYHVYEIL